MVEYIINGNLNYLLQTQLNQSCTKTEWILDIESIIDLH